MSAEWIVVVVIVVVLALSALGAAYLTAHRLDRLHIRTDLTRAALVGALERRHSVAAAVLHDLSNRDPDAGAALADALEHARAQPPYSVIAVDPAPAPDSRPRRAGAEADISAGRNAELAENELGIILGGIDAEALPTGLASELVDVTDRVSMARRFYNDAVRDTRNLREMGTVRVLRLAGRAPMPDYVELVDVPPAGA